MFSRIGAAAYKKDLYNTIELCRALDNPQEKFKSVHVAGTNGKGSTSHMLAAIFQQAGYKTGLYTSPHLKDFRERIKINGEMIAKDFVVEFTERNKILAEKIEPSFFELTVAMAFEYFAVEKVDIAIIETGLGGRLDSTNVILPELAVITNIGWDHMNILGDSLQKIAAEKAGIIKKDIPVVIGAYLPETKKIFEDKAVYENAKLYFAPECYRTSKTHLSAYSLACQVQNLVKGTQDEILLDLNGLYQAENLCTVLTSVDILNDRGFNVKDTSVKAALSQVTKITGLHGRWEVLQENPLLVLDVAHNEDGILQVMLQLKTFYKERQYHFVTGMVKDKEVENILRLFPKDAKYYFTNAHIPRALPAKDLRSLALTHNLEGDFFDDVNEAIKSAKLAASKKDIIIICGSVFLIGEVEV